MLYQVLKNEYLVSLYFPTEPYFPFMDYVFQPNQSLYDPKQMPCTSVSLCFTPNISADEF